MEMEAAAESLMDRLTAAAAALEGAAERLATFEIEASASREHDLETRLAEAETTIATLRAQATTRKTAPTLAAKEGVSLQAGALDAALASLSVEQRIAVKAQLLRSGFLG